MLPLARFTILDLTRVRSGPTCVRQLADWGANVIKIEAPEAIEVGAGMGGERHFSGSLALGNGAARWAESELVGRIFFGLFALMSALAAIGLWIKYARLFFRADTPTDHG